MLFKFHIQALSSSKSRRFPVNSSYTAVVIEGMSIKDGELVFNPKLPEKWNAMKFKVMYKGKLYSVRVGKNGVEIN